MLGQMKGKEKRTISSKIEERHGGDEYTTGKPGQGQIIMEKNLSKSSIKVDNDLMTNKQIHFLFYYILKFRFTSF